MRLPASGFSHYDAIWRCPDVGGGVMYNRVTVVGPPAEHLFGRRFVKCMVGSAVWAIKWIEIGELQAVPQDSYAVRVLR